MDGITITHGGRPVRIRAALRSDIGFMDRLQRADGRALGWFPTKQFEGYVDGVGGAMALVAEDASNLPLGYILYRDRYGGRDDVGAIYQAGVAARARRLGVGVSLVRAALASVAYGCRLMGAWCAQDLPAGGFWQSMGFTPIAFRTGSRGKGGKGGKGGVPRKHIYWQRRVNAGGGGDGEALWYPYETRGGAVREQRLVFPIMPGVDWRGELPVVLPEGALPTAEERVLLEASEAERSAAMKRRRAELAVRREAAAEAAERRRRPIPGDVRADGKMAILLHGRMRWVTVLRPPGWTPPPPPPLPEEAAKAVEVRELPPLPEPARHERVAVAFARELRDRWRERVAESGGLVALPSRHEVARLEGAEARGLPAKPVRMLPAA